LKILICTGISDENFRSGHVVIRTLQKMGHKVMTCGPVYGDFEGKAKVADVPLPDRKSFPEYYSYEDVVARCPEKPDLILQLESHFWFKGPNNTGIPSAVWVLDIHSGGRPFRDLIVEGDFDFVFLSFKYYAPHFQIKGIRPIWLPMGVDGEILMEDDVEEEVSDENEAQKEEIEKLIRDSMRTWKFENNTDNTDRKDYNPLLMEWMYTMIIGKAPEQECPFFVKEAQRIFLS
jgi:hypothetical protein